MIPRPQRLPAVSDAAIAGVRARMLGRARQNLDLVAPELLAGSGAPRVTLLVLTHDRPGCWPRLFRSIREHVRLPVKLLVVENHSAPEA